MQQTKKTITFDFEFKFPSHGTMAVANAITVCEPSFDERQVHAKMSVMVADAQVKAFKRATDLGFVDAAS